MKEMQVGSDAGSIKDLNGEIAKRRDTIPNGQYIANLIIMSIQWSAVSFSVYLLLFQRKYFEGSIYVNNYLDVIASILGSLIAWAFYDCLRIRWSFVLSLSISLIGCVLVLIFQEGYLSSAWVEPLLFFGESSPHEPGTAEDEAHYRNYCIPMILFIAYVGF